MRTLKLKERACTFSRHTHCGNSGADQPNDLFILVISFGKHFYFLSNITRIKMYFCVFLVVPKINLLVPAKWIFHLNVYSLVNNGVCTFEQHLIFYSNEDKPPNFLAPIRNNFDKTEDACYYANIVKVFGNFNISSQTVIIYVNLDSFNSDDNDTIAEKYVEGRRRIVPVYYKDPVKCLLSYEYEPRCDDSGSLPDTSAKGDILLLQKMICFLQEKFHDAAFDAQEKRAIQTIIIDDDAVEMQILLPTPKMEMEVKEEPGETAVEAISSTVTPENVNHVTDGHIQFQVNVSVFDIVASNCISLFSSDCILSLFSILFLIEHQ